MTTMSITKNQLYTLDESSFLVASAQRSSILGIHLRHNHNVHRHNYSRRLVRRYLTELYTRTNIALDNCFGYRWQIHWCRVIVDE